MSYDLFTGKISWDLAKKAIKTQIIANILADYSGALVGVLVWRKLHDKEVNTISRWILAIFLYIVIAILVVSLGDYLSIF